MRSLPIISYNQYSTRDMNEHEIIRKLKSKFCKPIMFEVPPEFRMESNCTACLISGREAALDKFGEHEVYLTPG